MSKTRAILILSLMLLIMTACGATSSPPPAAAPPAPAPAPAIAAKAPATVMPETPLAEDPYLYLEEITSTQALDWARQQNAKSTGELGADPGFEKLRKRLLGILDSQDKIPWITKQGKYFYNFWRDEAHPRGLWRRVASLDEYRKAAPAWETVIDLDALAKAENENWVWSGAECLYPKYEQCIVKMSRGGSDAVVAREFDAVARRFVEGGFQLPEAKSFVAWKDKDTIYVGTDFGPDTLTDSGYPRLTKEWKRGTPLSEARLIYEAKKTDIYTVTGRSWDHGHVRDFVKRGISFYEQESFLRRNDKLEPIPVPISAEIDTWDDQLLIALRDDWETGGKTWPKGSLLAVPLESFLKGKGELTALFTPAANKSLSYFSPLKSALIVAELEDVHNKANVWTHRGGKWKTTPFDAQGAISFKADAVEPDDTDQYWFVSTNFTLPSTLSMVKLNGKEEQLKQSPAFFDATGLVVEQHFAISKDATRVPYFQVSRKDLALDGQNPTLLNGYGGFEISLEPYYNPLVGAAWMEKGGVFVQANIRGGGEYGPAWHQAAVKENRQRAYDDFIAVAEDLIQRKVTSPARLGIEGASNGGLLMGVMLTERPDLFGAVVCEVPLLDMKRYNKLLAGASWMAEYGNPDVPAEWEALSRYSPYQNVKADVKYPRTLFTTSTRDDRVHPGHARKMVARMIDQGHDVLYYENIEGGHGGAANNEERAFMSTLAYTFLSRQLGLKP